MITRRCDFFKGFFPLFNVLVGMKKNLYSLLVAIVATTMSLSAQTVVIDDGFENGSQEDVWTQEFVSGHMAWAIESETDGLAYPATVVQGTHRAYLRNTTG